MTKVNRNIVQQSLEYPYSHESCLWNSPGDKSKQILYISQVTGVHSRWVYLLFHETQEGIKLERPILFRITNRGGKAISGAFHSYRISIITHTFSRLNIFKRRNRGWGYIPQKQRLRVSAPVTSAYGVYASPPLLMKLINHYGGVKNEPKKD